MLVQRRSYWLLDSADHVVLVHYLEGQASRRIVATQARAAAADRGKQHRKAEEAAEENVEHDVDVPAAPPAPAAPTDTIPPVCCFPGTLFAAPPGSLSK